MGNIRKRMREAEAMARVTSKETTYWRTCAMSFLEAVSQAVGWELHGDEKIRPEDLITEIIRLKRLSKSAESAGEPGDGGKPAEAGPKVQGKGADGGEPLVRIK